MLTACSFAPRYERPPMPIPSKYKEAGKWIEAKPNIAKATEKQPWWTLYHDKTLNNLEQKVTCDNNNLKIAFGRYKEVLAIAQAIHSAMYPTITGFGDVARQGNSKTVANVFGTPELTFNTFLLSPILNYEIDAWGRVRNSVIAGDSQARASEFDLAALDLSLHAELAGAYFELRGDDEAIRVLDTTVAAYQKALFLTRQRHKWGMVPVADVDEAISQLENAKTMATQVRLERAQLEHAIAILVGEIPSNFSLPPTKKPSHLVTISPLLPSTLVERRPDVAAAEQRAHAANATIGVARAAFLPQLNLVSMVGLQSQKLSKLFESHSLFWSIGPTAALSLVQPEITQVIFDGFKLEALLKQAKASYYETINAYKQTVLTAFQEVEDQLVAIKRLDEENTTQSASTAAAKRAWDQATDRYKGGLVTFLDVVIYENQALQSELALINIRTRRQVASVQLIKALGGGWCCDG